MMSMFRSDKGTTLVELLVALGVFAVLISILYPAFSLMTEQMTSINDKQLLSQRGERVINYLAEEIRMIGFLTGSNPNITHCGTTNVNAITHTDGNPYDSMAFLTSIPVLAKEGYGPFFKIDTPDPLNPPLPIGTTAIPVNVSQSNINKKYIDPNYVDPANNAKRLITFNTLAPTVLQKVYECSDFNGTTITLTTGLAQQLNDGSQIYAVRRKEITVDPDNTGERDLLIRSWNKECQYTGMTDILYPALGPGDAYGGVDGLQFEYTLENGTVLSSVTDADLPNLRSVTIWVLLRAGFPSRDFTDNSTYTMGTVSPVTAGPFNDPYRRILLRKIVEVKNLAF